MSDKKLKLMCVLLIILLLIKLGLWGSFMNKKELITFIIIGFLSLILGSLFGLMSGIKSTNNTNEKSEVIKSEVIKSEVIELKKIELPEESIKCVSGSYFIIDETLYPSAIIENTTNDDLSYITFNVIIYYKNGNVISNNSYTRTPIPYNSTTYASIEQIKISDEEIEKVEIQMENIK